MRSWIVALLDPSPIEKGTKALHNTHIQTPPRFDIEKTNGTVVLPPTSSLRPTRARSSRSASPSKIATPSRKIASPRKSRTTRSAAKTDVAATEEVAEAVAVDVLESVVENGTLVESVASESVNGEVKEVETKEETVHIEVEETVEQNGEVETTTTKVKIDVPADHPELRAPEDPAEMIAEATRMVQEATKDLEGSSEAPVSRVSKSKRKAEELSVDENGEVVATEERPAKLAKTETQAQQLTKERVTVRALLALTFTVGVGYVFQPLLIQRRLLTCHTERLYNISHELQGLHRSRFLIS